MKVEEQFRVSIGAAYDRGAYEKSVAGNVVTIGDAPSVLFGCTNDRHSAKGEWIDRALASPRDPASLRKLADDLESNIRAYVARCLDPNHDSDIQRRSFDPPRAEKPTNYLGTYSLMSASNIMAIGLLTLQYATDCDFTIAIGPRAGRRHQAGKRCILLGADTAAATPDADGFVNIDNRLCFWRDTGEIADIPKGGMH